MATRTPKTQAVLPKAAPKAKATKAEASTPKDVAASDGTPAVQLKFKDVIEQIVDRTGQRKGEVRTALQAALSVMGQALAEGKELNLQPMGKMSVNRTKETQRGHVHMVKMVQITKAPEGAVLADAPGDS